MSKKPRHVFLDSSVIISACASSVGASRLILEAVIERRITSHVSRVILRECERNLSKKFSKKELLFFYQWVGEAPVVLEELPAEEELDKLRGLIASKDVHVLATAVLARVDLLVTLDKRHFLSPKIKKAKLPLRIVTPGEFVKLILKN
jgi:putative PIN family toxin of toxin-antitoxin system